MPRASSPVITKRREFHGTGATARGLALMSPWTSGSPVGGGCARRGMGQSKWDLNSVRVIRRSPSVSAARTKTVSFSPPMVPPLAMP